jgi:beta-phosphoglucomutase
MGGIADSSIVQGDPVGVKVSTTFEAGACDIESNIANDGMLQKNEFFMSKVSAVIFDLDGVIVSTDALHYRAWKRMADEESIPFDEHDGEHLRGVGRMEALEMLLKKSPRAYSPEEKEKLATRKNNYYRDSLVSLSPADILPGVTDCLKALRERGIKMAIGSSSKNARPILEAIGLPDAFKIVVDGTHISRSKPDPEVFLLAAERLGITPAKCLVVEDAVAGVDAGLAAGMPVLAVGFATGHPKATLKAEDLSHITVDRMLGV